MGRYGPHGCFYSFARQSYKKNSRGLFFRLCGPSPGRGHQDRFLLGAIKKNRTDGRWKDAHLTCFLYVHKTAARRFRARLWFGAPSTKREKCVSFRLLPCVRKGRAAFVRRLPFSGFPTLRPGSGHTVEKAAGAFPRPFSIGVEVYVPNHRFPSYLRL